MPSLRKLIPYWWHRALIAVTALIIGILAGIFGLSSPAYSEGESVSGTLTVVQTREPVKGVSLGVTAGDTGESVGSATTAADGRFNIALPRPGSYQITIEVSTLPSGVKLAEAGANTRTITVNPGEQSAVLFRLSDGGKIGPETKTRWLQLVAEGIRFGLIVAITAVGLSLIFGTTGLTNLAHGELVTTGAFAAWAVNAGLGAPLWIATVVAVVVGMVLGGLNDLALWRPLRKRGAGLMTMLVVSIGLGLALRHLTLMLFGGDTESYTVPAEKEIDLGLVFLTPRDLLAMALCTAVLAGIALMLQYTKIGVAIRAVADNRELAESSGINVNRVILMVWIVGGGLAAFGGVMYGWTLSLRYDMGFTLLLVMFAGVVLGGIGSAYGALLGGVLIGVVMQLSTLVIPDDIKMVAGLVVLILVLLIRPRGLLGLRMRVG